MAVEALLVLLKGLISQYGYIALFFSSIVSAATVIIPVPLYVLIFFASNVGLNPLIVGIVSGIGSGLGEITGYWVGMGGRKVLGKKIKKIPKQIHNINKLIKKYGFFGIFAFGLLPLPFDVIGIISGANHFGLKKFLLAAILSKIIKTLLIAYAGSFTLPFIEYYLNPFVQ